MTNQHNGKNKAAFQKNFGSLWGKVWLNATQDGSQRESVEITKSYRRSDGTWGTTNRLRESDILNARRLLDECLEFLRNTRPKQDAVTGEEDETMPDVPPFFDEVGDPISSNHLA